MKTFELPITGHRNRRRTVIGHAIIPDDEQTRAIVIPFRWNIQPHNYVSRRDNLGKKLYLHRIIYAIYHGEMPEGKEVDHKDRNPLNNLPDNLRAATRGLNNFNSNRIKPSKSGIRGVWL